MRLKKISVSEMAGRNNAKSECGNAGKGIAEMKYAVIDIGSNSVRLLLWADGHTVSKEKETTRLGEGLSATQRLQETAIERTVRAIEIFKVKAERFGAIKIFAFATAAARRAQNGGELIARIREKCKIETEIIDGETEARIGLLGALNGQDGGIIDVGGASTEITVARQGQAVFSASLDIGAVRIKDVCGGDREETEKYIAKMLRPLQGVPKAVMTGIGGTATSLAALEYAVEPYDAAKINGKTVSLQAIESWADRLLAMTREERIALKGMDRSREDILGGGALLLASIVSRIGASEIFVSDSDNLEGYLAEKLKGGRL